MPKAAGEANLLPRRAFKEQRDTLPDPEICALRSGNLTLDTADGSWYLQKGLASWQRVGVGKEAGRDHLDH